MRLQAESQEEEQTSKLKVGGILTLEEWREETGQYAEEEAQRARGRCLQHTRPALVALSGQPWGSASGLEN